MTWEGIALRDPSGGIRIDCGGGDVRSGEKARESLLSQKQAEGGGWRSGSSQALQGILGHAEAREPLLLPCGVFAGLSVGLVWDGPRS